MSLRNWRAGALCLVLLHARHDGTQFSSRSVPLPDSGTTWSIVIAPPRFFETLGWPGRNGTPQYAQR